jgi:5-methyltetrahydrofolate--homocysteine methyltransferase
VFKYINENALFRGQWQMKRGKLKDEEYREVLESEIYPEFERIKKKAIRENLLQPKLVYGYFPCQSEKNDLIVYRPVVFDNLIDKWRNVDVKNRDKLKEWVRIKFPRQTTGRNLCIADYFAPEASGIMDVVSFFLVTMGDAASTYAEVLYNNHNYKEYLYFHGLSVEAAEALAEMWHKIIRKELNIYNNDVSEPEGLFNRQYRGARYSFGYPACPNLEDQKILFEILKPERIGVCLTETFQLVPEQSTSAIVVHHPEARYFSI